MKNFLNKVSYFPKGFFKWLFWNLFFGYLLIAIIASVLAYLGIRPTTFNDEAVSGLKGFIIEIVIIFPVSVLLFSCVIWLFLKIGNLIINFLNKVF